MCSDIPAAPALGVYVSQLIRYSTACGSYNDFHNRSFLLVKLKSSFRKFYGRYHDLVTQSLCHKWPWICTIYCSHNPVLSSFMTYHRIVTRVTRRAPHVEQELPTLPEHMTPYPVFSVVRFLILYVLFCRSFLFLFFWPMHCLSLFDLRLWYLIYAFGILTSGLCSGGKFRMTSLSMSKCVLLIIHILPKQC